MTVLLAIFFTTFVIAFVALIVGRFFDIDWMLISGTIIVAVLGAIVIITLLIGMWVSVLA